MGSWALTAVGSRPSQSRDKTALLRKIKDTGPEVGGGKDYSLHICSLGRGEIKASREGMRGKSGPFPLPENPTLAITFTPVS